MAFALAQWSAELFPHPHLIAIAFYRRSPGAQSCSRRPHNPVKHRRRTARLARLQRVTQASGSRSNVRREASQIILFRLRSPMDTRYQHSSFANHTQITRSMLQSNDSLLHDSLPTPSDSLSRATSPAACDVPAMCNRHALTQCAWKPFLPVQQCLRRSAEHLRLSRCP